jgi:ATP-dependent DNA helicase RecG
VPEATNNVVMVGNLREAVIVGLGEQAGTGIPKILHGWQSEHWSPPNLHESVTPYNQTLLELRMIDLCPEEVMESLKHRFGRALDRLTHAERVALALAASEGTVNHARLRALTTEHPFDLSKTLQHLTQAGFLESTGGRGAIYHLPGEPIPTPDDVFGPATRFSVPSSPNLAASSPNLAASSRNLAESRDPDGCLISEQLSLPVVDDLEPLSQALRSRLEGMASEPRAEGKVDRQVLNDVVVQLCEGRFVTLRSLAELVHRKPDTLRDQYLKMLVRQRQLNLAFPKTPNHERQAYTPVSNVPE